MAPARNEVGADYSDKPILVLAPLGRDAELACAMLNRAGLACKPGNGLAAIDREKLDEISALVLTEELLSSPNIEALTGMLDAQPSWSSLPVVLLVDPESRRSREAAERLREVFASRMGVILIQRPMHPASFVSVMRSAALARQRQYQLRDQLDARAKAEAHARMLADEMQHRVKNSLTLAASIASQTFRSAISIEEGVTAFSARLEAMSRAQNLLTTTAEDSADLRDLIDQALEPYRPREDLDPFDIEGPEIRIGARMATAFAMAFHELATNAVKYGALSTRLGSVNISWKLDNTAINKRLLHVDWKERGGPPVFPPQQRGFGSRLIERALAYDLGGHARIAFDPEGVNCQISATLGSEKQECV